MMSHGLAKYSYIIIFAIVLKGRNYDTHWWKREMVHWGKVTLPQKHPPKTKKTQRAEIYCSPLTSKAYVSVIFTVFENPSRQKAVPVFFFPSTSFKPQALGKTFPVKTLTWVPSTVQNFLTPSNSYLYHWHFIDHLIYCHTCLLSSLLHTNRAGTSFVHWKFSTWYNDWHMAEQIHLLS